MNIKKIVWCFVVLMTSSVTGFEDPVVFLQKRKQSLFYTKSKHALTFLKKGLEMFLKNLGQHELISTSKTVKQFVECVSANLSKTDIHPGNQKILVTYPAQKWVQTNVKVPDHNICVKYFTNVAFSTTQDETPFCVQQSIWNFQVHKSLRLNFSVDHLYISSKFCAYGKIIFQTFFLNSNATDVFCGFQPKFVLFPATSRSAVVLDINFRFDYFLLFFYQIIEANIIHNVYSNKAHQENSYGKMFFFPTTECFLSKTLIKLEETRRMEINISGCGNNCWVFDGPGTRMNSIKMYSQQGMVVTSTFQCLIIFLAPKKALTVQYVSFNEETKKLCLNMTFPGHFVFSPCQNITFLVMEIEVKRENKQKVTISDINYFNMFSIENCLLGGLVLFEFATATGNHRRQLFCNEKAKMRRFYSHTPKVTVVFFLYSEYGQIALNVTIEETMCSPIEIDICKIPLRASEANQFFQKLLNENYTGNNHADIFVRTSYLHGPLFPFPFFLRQDDALLLSLLNDFCTVFHISQRSDEVEGKLDNCYLYITPKEFLLPGRMIQLDISGYLFDGLPDETTKIELKKFGERRRHVESHIIFEGDFGKYKQVSDTRKSAIIFSRNKTSHAKFSLVEERFQLTSTVFSPYSTNLLGMWFVWKRWFTESWCDIEILSKESDDQEQNVIPLKNFIVNPAINASFNLHSIPKEPVLDNLMVVQSFQNSSSSLHALKLQLKLTTYLDFAFDCCWNICLHFTKHRTETFFAIQGYYRKLQIAPQMERNLVEDMNISISVSWRKGFYQESSKITRKESQCDQTSADCDITVLGPDHEKKLSFPDFHLEITWHETFEYCEKYKRLSMITLLSKQEEWDFVKIIKGNDGLQKFLFVVFVGIKEVRK